MAQHEALQIVVATFEDRGGAEFAMQRVRTGQVPIQTHAILVRDEGGKLSVRDAADLGQGKGAIAGAIIGLLLPGVGLIGGALVGAIAARLRDAGFADQRLRRLGEELPPSSSALILVVDPPAVATVRPILERVRGTVVVSGIDADIALPPSPEE